MLAAGLKPPVLVFVATKERAKALCRELMYEKARVDTIHADQSHAARAAAVANFRRGHTWVLITTDLLARGMDFLGVQAVVNYDFPGTKTDYIHRCDDGHAPESLPWLYCKTYLVSNDIAENNSVVNGLIEFKV